MRAQRHNASSIASSSSLREAWRTDTWVKPALKRYRAMLIGALVLGVSASVFSAGLMFSAGYLISATATLPATVLLLNIPLMFVRFFGVGKPLLSYVNRLVSHDWVLRLTSYLRLRLYQMCEREAAFFHTRHRTGDMLGLLDEDIGHIQDLFLRSIFPIITAWILWAVLLVFLSMFSLRAAFVLCLVIAIPTSVVPYVSLSMCRALKLKEKQLKNDSYASLTDDVLGLGDLVCAQRSETFLSSHEKAQAHLRSVQEQLNRHTRRRDIFSQVLFGIGAVVLIVLLTLAFGGSPADGIDSPTNWIAAFLLVYFPLLEAFFPVSSAVLSASAHADSLIRLNSFTQVCTPDKAGEMPWDACGKRKDQAFSLKTSRHSIASDVDAHFPDIEIDDVCFCYQGGSYQVLDHLTLTIPPRQKVAVLGRSGEGKTTLLSLIRGDILPDEGSVMIGAAPPAAYGDDIVHTIGVIEQKPYIFNDTLLENVRLGRPDASASEVETALEQVGLSSLIARLPRGLHTRIDEAGVCFSGGERHRIAIARLLVARTSIVMLDEPFVGLDPACEHELMDTLLDVFADNTLILVTHHLQGASKMDRVVFIEDGRVAIDGKPADLERTNARYARLLAFDRGDESRLAYGA